MKSFFLKLYNAKRRHEGNTAIHSRYTQIDFPVYAHRPGKTPHPKKEGGHSEAMPDPTSHKITLTNWQTHQDYLYGVDLFNHGYFWEAHVWWEAIWKACPKNENRDFIQGLIKLAAAALKFDMDEPELAYGHAIRGRELMSKVYERQAIKSYFGVSRKWWDNSADIIHMNLELNFDD